MKAQFDVAAFVARYWLQCAIGAAAFLILLAVVIAFQRPGTPPQPVVAEGGGGGGGGGALQVARGLQSGRAAAKLLTGEPRYSLDVVAVGSQSFPAGSAPATQTVPAGQPVALLGWAYDKQAGKPASGVAALIDGGRPVPGKYGAARPDVAKAFSDDALVPTGFVVTLPANLLASGDHEVSLEIFNSDGTGYYLVPDRLKLIVK